MLIVVEEDGSVGDVQVEKAWRPDVDNKVIETVKKWQFSHATKVRQTACRSKRTRFPFRAVLMSCPIYPVRIVFSDPFGTNSF